MCAFSMFMKAYRLRAVCLFFGGIFIYIFYLKGIRVKLKLSQAVHHGLGCYKKMILGRNENEGNYFYDV
jgi:hypothetical protein